MKRWIWILAVIVLIVVVISWRAFSLHVEHRPDVAATPEMVKRGEYLVQAGDCISCHTAPGKAAFSGGREFDLGGMGTLYSPNITPDKDTGIGSWSDDDFRSALQLGIGKGGEHLYPAFPYASFTILSDDDVLAIKAYLFSLAPVKNEPPADAMKFPYNQRALMAYWSWLFDSNKRFAADASQSAAWNRGKYLVDGLAHCGECHTSRNFLQARSSSKEYAGAVTQGWKAYNITSDKDTGIGNWTDDALVSYLTTGFAAGHGPASGPMAEAISNSLRHLTADDVHAIATYVRSLEPKAAAVPVVASASSASPDANMEYGRQVYARECANCHHRDGSGTQSDYEMLRGSRTVGDPEAINLTQIVLHGETLETANGRITMPSFGKLSDTDVAAVVNYTAQTLGGHAPNLTPQDIAARR